MREKVWVSDFVFNPELAAAYKSFGVPNPHLALQARRRGESIAAPKFKAVDDVPQKIGLLAIVGGPHALVSADLAEVLSAFDLGKGGFPEVKMFKADEITPLPLHYHMWDYFHGKECFVPEQSTDMSQAKYGNNDPQQDLWTANFIVKSGQVALNGAALVGPDIWTVRYVRDLVFFSDRVKQALCDQGLGEVLRFAQCRLV